MAEQEKPEFVELTKEQIKEKDKIEKEVSPETNATFTKLSPAPDAPQTGDRIEQPYRPLPQ